MVAVSLYASGSAGPFPNSHIGPIAVNRSWSISCAACVMKREFNIAQMPAFYNPGIACLTGNTRTRAATLSRRRIRSIGANSEAMDDMLIPLAAAALVVLSVLFGWWSFRFSEDGATPDDWRSLDPTLDMDLDTEMISMGGRARARLCARTLFGIAALCLIASIPLGYVDAHRTTEVTPLMIGISAAVFVFAVV